MKTTITRQAAYDRITKSIAEQVRSAVAEVDTDAQALQAARIARAVVYAAINYGYDLSEVVTDAIYFALVDAYDAFDLFISLLRRNSPLDEIGAELCVAACANAVAAVGDSADPILGAVVKACGSATTVIAAMADAGEAEEKRALGAGKSETRVFHSELRAVEASAAAPTSIIGYPLVFGQPSEEMADNQGRRFVEVIDPNAVTFSSDVRADFNHDRNFILGRVSKGSLKLSVDAKGVRMDVTPPDTQWARDLMTQIGRGDIDQGSFEFRVLPGGESWNVDRSIRTLTKILVSRVSVVSDPAYVQTGMSVRELKEPVHPVSFVAGVNPDLLGRLLDLRLAEV